MSQETVLGYFSIYKIYENKRLPPSIQSGSLTLYTAYKYSPILLTSLRNETSIPTFVIFPASVLEELIFRQMRSVGEVFSPRIVNIVEQILFSIYIGLPSPTSSTERWANHDQMQSKLHYSKAFKAYTRKKNNKSSRYRIANRH